LFTGLIEDRGTVTASSGGEITLSTSLWKEASPGDSMAVDGSCLTVTGAGDGSLSFHCSQETLSKTVVSKYRPGSRVNLERPMLISDRLHGHILTGHVDETASVLKVRRSGAGMTAWISYSKDRAELLVPRGSVAVSGISLTIASLDSRCFSVALIPETLERTTAGSWAPGSAVNLEYDILGKYVRRRLDALLGDIELRRYLERY